ncbi:MAG: ABC transporter permease [Chloroflexi bacterium]|nr:ABC transporter permease [Chloroflexota bacterium]
MNWPSRRAVRVWQRDRDVFFRMWKAEFIPYFVEPLVILAALGLGLGGFIGLVGQQNYLQFLTPGVVVAYAMFTATFECTYGSYIRMEMQRTFDAIIATPLSIEDVITGEIMWAATRSLMTSVAIILVALLFNVVPFPTVVLVPVAALLVGLMFGSMGMFFTSLAPSISSFNYYFTLFITPIYFFSGVFFPLSSLPPVFQRISEFIPLAPAVDLSRGLFYGEWHPRLMLDLAFILALTVAFFLASLVTMRRRLIK